MYRCKFEILARPLLSLAQFVALLLLGTIESRRVSIYRGGGREEGGGSEAGRSESADASAAVSLSLLRRRRRRESQYPAQHHYQSIFTMYIDPTPPSFTLSLSSSFPPPSFLPFPSPHTKPIVNPLSFYTPPPPPSLNLPPSPVWTSYVRPQPTSSCPSSVPCTAISSK